MIPMEMARPCFSRNEMKEDRANPYLQMIALIDSGSTPLAFRISATPSSTVTNHPASLIRFEIVGARFSQSLRTPRSNKTFSRLSGCSMRNENAGQSRVVNPLIFGSMNISLGMPLILEVLLIIWTSTIAVDSGMLRTVAAIFSVYVAEFQAAMF